MKYAAEILHDEVPTSPEEKWFRVSRELLSFSLPCQPVFYHLNEFIRLQQFYKIAIGHAFPSCPSLVSAAQAKEQIVQGFHNVTDELDTCLRGQDDLRNLLRAKTAGLNDQYIFYTFAYRRS